jgi:hypothetical protein
VFRERPGHDDRERPGRDDRERPTTTGLARAQTLPAGLVARAAPAALLAAPRGLLEPAPWSPGVALLAASRRS